MHATSFATDFYAWLEARLGWLVLASWLGDFGCGFLAGLALTAHWEAFNMAPVSGFGVR